MDVSIDNSTRIGLGFATRSDAFQCGREAAQEAKNQLTEGPVSLVLIVGPGTVHFKDFIEGARLVLGEEALVAIPTGRTLSSETALPNTCFVAAFQAPGMRMSIATDDIDDGNLLRKTTSLVSQFRRARGNAVREFGHRGCLVFSHQLAADDNGLATALGADLGLESWMIGAATASKRETPLICSNKTIQRGLVGVEFLSSVPWGVGSVEIGPFMTQTDVYREALKTAVRDALGQMQSQPPCFGLVFLNVSNEAAAALPDDFLSSAAGLVPRVPMLGLSTAKNFVRRPQRSAAKENDSILALLVPA